jgi:hypothetical protein
MKLAALLIVLCSSIGLFARDIERDKLMWRMAHNGEFAIVHKLAIMREVEDVNDKLLSQFVMAYLYYKMERFDEIEVIFNGIDHYIQHALILKER